MLAVRARRNWPQDGARWVRDGTLVVRDARRLLVLDGRQWVLDDMGLVLDGKWGLAHCILGGRSAARLRTQLWRGNHRRRRGTSRSGEVEMKQGCCRGRFGCWKDGASPSSSLNHYLFYCPSSSFERVLRIELDSSNDNCDAFEELSITIITRN